MAPKQTKSNKKGTPPPSRKTSPTKQKGMLQNQQKKDLWESKNTFLVYKSDKEVSAGMSFEQATSMFKVLPSAAKKSCELMTFESEAKFDSFMESFVSIDANTAELSTDVTILDKKHDTIVVSPEKTNTAASKPKTSLADLKSRLTDSLIKPYANPKLESDKKKGHLDILNRLKKVVALPPNLVKVHFFPNTPACSKASVVMLEFCKRSDGFNMWLHKPEAWQAVLGADHDFLIFPEALKDMTHCVHRAKPFVEGTIEKVKKSGNYTIKASALCFPIQVGLSEDNIRDFVSSTFGKITSDPEFQDCYSMVVAQLGSSSKTMQAIPGYYKDFADALHPEMIAMVPHFSLDEIFTSKQIDIMMTFFTGTSLSDCASKKYSSDGYERNHFEEFAFKP